MNDEAGTDYEAIIDQMTEGHTFLFNGKIFLPLIMLTQSITEEFGVRPTIGWHIGGFARNYFAFVLLTIYQILSAMLLHRLRSLHKWDLMVRS